MDILFSERYLPLLFSLDSLFAVVGSFVSHILVFVFNNPLILLVCLVPFVGLAFVFFKRLLDM